MRGFYLQLGISRDIYLGLSSNLRILLATSSPTLRLGLHSRVLIIDGVLWKHPVSRVRFTRCRAKERREPLSLRTWRWCGTF
jgi:hypothetical protein